MYLYDIVLIVFYYFLRVKYMCGHDDKLYIMSERETRH